MKHLRFHLPAPELPSDKITAEEIIMSMDYDVQDRVQRHNVQPGSDVYKLLHNEFTTERDRLSAANTEAEPDAEIEGAPLTEHNAIVPAGPSPPAEMDGAPLPAEAAIVVVEPAPPAEIAAPSPADAAIVAVEASSVQTAGAAVVHEASRAAQMAFLRCRKGSPERTGSCSQEVRDQCEAFPATSNYWFEQWRTNGRDWA